MTRQLVVWLFGTHVGTLSQIDGVLRGCGCRFEQRNRGGLLLHFAMYILL